MAAWPCSKDSYFANFSKLVRHIKSENCNANIRLLLVEGSFNQRKYLSLALAMKTATQASFFYNSDVSKLFRLKLKLICHFRVHVCRHLKASLSAKFLWWLLVLLYIWLKTTFHKNNFTLRLALKRRQIWSRKWPIRCKFNFYKHQLEEVVL